MTTLTYTGTLERTHCWCGIHHAVPTSLLAESRRNGTNVYCPVGHSGSYATETENTRLKRDLQWERDRVAAERARADGAEASLRTTKDHVTRLRKHVAAGECPFCGQHLRDLQRHVTRQHAAEAADAILKETSA